MLIRGAWQRQPGLWEKKGIDYLNDFPYSWAVGASYSGMENGYYEWIMDEIKFMFDINYNLKYFIINKEKFHQLLPVLSIYTIYLCL